MTTNYLIRAAIGMLLASSSTAWASRIPSDTPHVLPFSSCSFGSGPCAGSDLGVGFANGYLTPAFGQYDPVTFQEIGNIYIYDSGVISLNGPLPANADLTKPSTLGTSVLLPGLISSGSYSVSGYLGSGCKYLPYDCVGGSDVEILFGSGSLLFGVRLMDLGPDTGTAFTKIGVSFDYGSDADFPASTGNFPTTKLPTGALIGYDVGGSTLLEAAPSDPGATDIGGVFDVSMPGVPLPVPEPKTWALMLTGLGVVGASLRRRTSRPLKAA